ncbi:uncharacterized protein [Patagioenas fasciata]|uniref:uncharacterized protein n=1 Tax=Patagioenas fasciata TaxID=372321 RepID=UPI003A9905BE
MARPGSSGPAVAVRALLPPERRCHGRVLRLQRLRGRAGARGCGPAGRGRAVAVLPPGGRRVALGRQWGGPAGRPRSSAVENPPHKALGPRSPPVPSRPPCARPLHADLSWLPPAAVSSGPQLPFLFDGEHLTVLCMAKTMRTLDRKSLPSAAFLSPLGSDNSPGIATAAPTAPVSRRMAPTAPVSRQQHRQPRYRDSSTNSPGITTDGTDSPGIATGSSDGAGIATAAPTALIL